MTASHDLFNVAVVGSGNAICDLCHVKTRGTANMFKMIGPDGVETGPVDLATLQSLVTQGRVRPDTTVVDTATGTRSTAATVPALAEAFRAISPQPLPPAAVEPLVKLVPCPACRRNLSVEAASCPNCGHPMKPPPVVGDPWTEVGRVGGFVAVAVGTLMLGVQAVFLKLVGGGDVGAETLSKVFLQTVPLTVAVMLIVLSVLQKWFEDIGPYIFFSAVALFLSIVIGSWWGGLGKIPEIEANWIKMYFKLLAFYWDHYGPSLFLSSLTLGGYLAWATNKLLPKVSTVTPKGAGSPK